MLEVQRSVAIMPQVAILLEVTCKQCQTWRSPARSLVTASLDPLLSMSMRFAQQPTQTAVSFVTHQVKPHDIPIDGSSETQHSAISNTGSLNSGSTDIAMCRCASVAYLEDRFSLFERC